MKTCRECGFVGDAALFEKDRNRCRACGRARNKKYRIEKYEEKKAGMEKWRVKNPDKVIREIAITYYTRYSGLPRDAVPQDLIDLKVQHLTLVRKLRKQEEVNG